MGGVVEWDYAYHLLPHCVLSYGFSPNSLENLYSDIIVGVHKLLHRPTPLSLYCGSRNTLRRLFPSRSQKLAPVLVERDQN
uniref:Uncharacterized protein n=1 Tax=Magallana gigas TaxID=29159 RepID=A0A8W8LYN6_MAGGI